MTLKDKGTKPLLALALALALGLGVTPAWASEPTEGQAAPIAAAATEQDPTIATAAEEQGQNIAATATEQAEEPTPPAADGSQETESTAAATDDELANAGADADEVGTDEPQAVSETATLLRSSARGGSVEMMRLYNPNSGEHFYTGSSDECYALRVAGWSLEGVGWVAPASSNVPVYRLYNPNGGDHHYTTSADERDQLAALGWVYEGVGWYSDAGEAVPLLRQYNPNATSGSHNFTTSRSENDQLVERGWNAEGIGWYALAEGRKLSSEEKSFIYIDAGHGYQSNKATKWDPGACSGGHSEAKLTHEHAPLVARYARELYGLNVFCNVDEGPSLVDYSGRMADAKGRGCTSLVSIHFNAGGGSGYESYRHSKVSNPRSAQLQSIMHAQLESTGLRNRGMQKAEIAIVSGRNGGLPATLLEICFIDNPYDVRQYMDRRDKVARALAKGLYEAAKADF